MFGQSSPIALVLCAILVFVFGLIQVHVSRKTLTDSRRYHIQGPVVGTAAGGGYYLENRDRRIKVEQKQIVEQVSNEDGKEEPKANFYSENYWSMSLEKRSEVSVS